MKRKFVIMLFVLAGSYGLVTAQQPAVMVSSAPGWHKIGSSTVDFKTDRDEISVLGNDKFSQLKLRVEDAAVDMQDLEVYFENGTKQDVQVRTPMKPGTETRVIDLEGGTREIKKVVFVYKTIGSTDTKATVVLYGMKPGTNTTDMDKDRMRDADKDRKYDKTENDRMHDNNNMNDNNKTYNSEHSEMAGKKGWEKLGESNADLTRDRDIITLTHYNRITGIKFFVTDADLEIMDMKVFFGNGTSQDISVRSKIKAGGESRVIDLTGEARDIKRIEFVYKTEPNRTKNKAHVEVWGKGSISDAKLQGDVKHNVHHNHNTSTAGNGGVPKPEIITSDKPGWHKIGENTVSFKKETDEIALLGSDRFAKIKFKVKDAGIVINDLQIWYEDGTKQDVSVKSTFAEGGESRVIDVPGSEKDIKRIVFRYRTIPNQEKDKAHVEIWGYKTNNNKTVGANEK